MPTALQTPLREGQAEKVGKRLYRKQVLPVGSVHHEGHELKFTPEYLKRLADSFTAGAMDQVPLVLVDDSNKHSQDPEKVRGDVTAMEVHDDGLYAVMQLSERGEQLVSDNPKLGVSARIDQEKGAIEHVAATVNPVVKGMKAWEAIDLSNDDVTVIDLSDGKFEVPSTPPNTPPTVSTDALKPEEVKSLKALAERLGGKDASKPEELTEDDIARLLNPEKSEENEETEPVAALSEKDQKRIDLAETTAREAKDKAGAAAERQAEAEWKLTEQRYLNEGVPPSILKLAKPHLAKASAVVELSNADSQASAMKKMLDENKGRVDLSERSSLNAEDRETEESEAKELAKDEVWEKV